MSDDLVERLSTEAKIWPRSDISGLLLESVTEIERLRAEVEGLRARIDGAPTASVSMVASNEESGNDDATTTGTYLHGESDNLHGLIGKRVALVVVE